MCVDLKSTEDALREARKNTTEAGQLLRLVRFQVHSAAPIFGAGISTYADMLDPNGTDLVRLAACRRLIAPVARQAVLEELCVKHMEAAVEAFERAGI